MRKGIDKKIVDSDSQISAGGRLRDYWARRGMKQKRSGFVVWNGEDIPLQDILKQYNLAGFEFGRYVNNEDRNDFLIAAKESLADLSGLMHSKNIGFDKQIGVAFGARGMGGSATAHYEPTLNMINLTKNRGFGALAHEYGHALDYNIGMYVDQNKTYAALSGGRSTAKSPVGNTGGDCRTLMAKLIYEIKLTASFGRLKKAGDYWHYNTEVFARFFEQWCCYKLREKKKQNDCLTHTWLQYTTTRPYLTEADFRKVLPTAEKLIRNMGLVLEGKKTEPATPLEIVRNKEENPKVAAKPKAEPKPKKASKPKAEKPKAKKASKPMKLAYQDYDKAFKALSKFASREQIKPVMNTVYHSDREMMATNDHILAVIHDAKYPKAKEGKMVLTRDYTDISDKKHVDYKAGDILPGVYPRYKAVVSRQENLDNGVEIDVDAELKKAKAVEDKLRKLKAEAKASKDYNYLDDHGVLGTGSSAFIPVTFGKQRLKNKNLVTALSFLSGAGAKKAMYYQDRNSSQNRAAFFKANNCTVMIMPVMVNN